MDILWGTVVVTGRSHKPFYVGSNPTPTISHGRRTRVVFRGLAVTQFTWVQTPSSTLYALVVELGDTYDLESYTFIVCGFDSHRGHHVSVAKWFKALDCKSSFSVGSNPTRDFFNIFFVST